MSKLLLALLVLMGVLVGGFLLATTLGTVPLVASSVLQNIQEALVPLRVTQGPLRKFEGYWDLTLVPLRAGISTSECITYKGVLSAHNGVFTGRVGVLASFFDVVATSTEDGQLTGTLTANEPHAGTLAASLEGKEGLGTWVDSLNCAGKLTLTKHR